MQYDLRFHPKKFEPLFAGEQRALYTDCTQPVTAWSHVLVHEHDRRGPTGRWVRLQVTHVEVTTAHTLIVSVRMIARSTDKCKRAA